MNRRKTYLLWALKIIISLGFLLASSGKLTQNEQVIQMFSEWGYFEGFHLIIGVLEFGFAILLLVPRTAFYASIALGVLMIGALITHLLHDPVLEIIRPLIFMAILGVVIYLERNKPKNE